jgi:butyrate kinase
MDGMKGINGAMEARRVARQGAQRIQKGKRNLAFVIWSQGGGISGKTC